MASGSRNDAAKGNALASTASSAAATAAAPSEGERRITDRAFAWDDWRTGKKGPVDIRNAPDQIGMALANDAINTHDANRQGKGYGSLASGANPNFSAALDKETQLERDKMGGAELENYITGQLGQADQNLYGVANMEKSRAENAAALAQAAYQAFLNRPGAGQPGFLKQMAIGALGMIKLPTI